MALATVTLVPNPNCYGRRKASMYEMGLNLTTNPSKNWYAFVDYRLVLDQSTSSDAPAGIILTHVLLMRVEARY